jgi:hypothetical protein
VNRQSNPDAKWLGPRGGIVKLIVGMADEDMKVGKAIIVHSTGILTVG